MSIAFRVVGGIVLIAVLIWLSCALDKKWRAAHPQDASFRWGYFQALCFFPAGLLWFLVPFIATHVSWLTWLYVIFYGTVGSYAGYALIAQKKRWAWLFVVVVQFNLINWIINYYYGSKRWKEFQ